MTAVLIPLTGMMGIPWTRLNNAKMKVTRLLLAPYPPILPVNVLITTNILPNVWKTDPELAKKQVLPKLNVLPVWLLIQPALMMATTKNVNATPAPVILIPMRKLRLRVMLLTEAVKAAQKQNTSAKKTPAPVTQLANAAVKSVLQSAIAALLKNLRVAKNAAMILVLRAIQNQHLQNVMIRLQQSVVQLVIKEKVVAMRS